MENPEEVLHSLEEFSKMKPKDIPRELEEYLCFVAKTGDPIYQWSAIKSLLREKLISVVTEFYESCPSIEIPPCPNVEMFNYDLMKNFILEKLDTFAAAPFTVQRICELLTTPRKEYNRIDKYMRALEKNILVVTTTEPGGRRNTENGESLMNGIETEHIPEPTNCSHEINVEEMDESPSWQRTTQTTVSPYKNTDHNDEIHSNPELLQETTPEDTKTADTAISSSQEPLIECRDIEEQPYVSIEPVPSTTTCSHQDNIEESQDVTVTITAIPAGVQNRRSSIEDVPSQGSEETNHKDEVSKETSITVEDTFKETPINSEETIEELPTEESTDAPTESLLQMESESNILLAPVNSGIENISPESTTSSPETLQSEVSEDSEASSNSEKAANETIVEDEKSTEQIPDTTTENKETPESIPLTEENEEIPEPSEIKEISPLVEETNEVSLSETEETETKIYSEEPKTDSMDSEEKTCEPVIDSSDNAIPFPHTAEPVVSSTPAITEESTTASDPSSSSEDKTEQTPMDVDVTLSDKTEIALKHNAETDL